MDGFGRLSGRTVPPARDTPCGAGRWHRPGGFTCAPTSPADILKLYQEGDANLALRVLIRRWMVDRLADGKVPDEFLFQKMVAVLTWNEAGVLQLSTAGLDKGVLRALAIAKPLACPRKPGTA